MRPRVCYVVALWGGPRRIDNVILGIPRERYLLAQIQSLRHRSHQLDQIIFVDNGFDEEPGKYADVIASLEGHRRLGAAPFELIRRPNKGMSYGAFDEVYAKYRQNFNYYFMVEDDHVFVMDNFDRIAVGILESEHDPRCGSISPFVRGGEHHAVQSGLFRAAYLDDMFNRGHELGDLWARPGRLPCSDNEHYCHAEQAQRLWGLASQHLGWSLADWHDRYEVAIMHAGGGWEGYGKGKPQFLVNVLRQDVPDDQIFWRE